MKPPVTTIDEYIADFPEEIRIRMERLRATIQKAAPKAEECISYSIPTYKLQGNLVHFAAYKNHIGFYVGPDVLKLFSDEISSFKTATGTVQFPHTKPIPLGLVTKIVKHRIKQNAEKAKEKMKKKNER